MVHTYISLIFQVIFCFKCYSMKIQRVFYFHFYPKNNLPSRVRDLYMYIPLEPYNLSMFFFFRSKIELNAMKTNISWVWEVRG